MNSYERIYSLLLEAHKPGGRFTPEDHDYEGRVGSKSAQKGTNRMKKQVSASPKGATIAIGREGNVPHPETEKEIGKHAKAQGKEVVTYGLEHPETDVHRAGDYSEKKPGRAVDRKIGREYGPGLRQAMYHAAQASHGGKRKPTGRARNLLRRLGFDPDSQESMKKAAFPQDDSSGKNIETTQHREFSGKSKRMHPIGAAMATGNRARTIGHRYQEREQRGKGRTTVQKVGSGLFRKKKK